MVKTRVARFFMGASPGNNKYTRIRSQSGEPSGLADAALLGQEPREVLGNHLPRLGCARECKCIAEGHRDLEPGQIHSRQRFGRETDLCAFVGVHNGLSNLTAACAQKISGGHFHRPAAASSRSMTMASMFFPARIPRAA